MADDVNLKACSTRKVRVDVGGVQGQFKNGTCAPSTSTNAPTTQWPSVAPSMTLAPTVTFAPTPSPYGYAPTPTRPRTGFKARPPAGATRID